MKCIVEISSFSLQIQNHFVFSNQNQDIFLVNSKMLDIYSVHYKLISISFLKKYTEITKYCMNFTRIDLLKQRNFRSQIV
ncbi:unnamed protein product (macronuclear) [Paramecium tetraurelia]|uniref:Uncharacterized protein n=1 Tax=Paramecium tetraurelia TaxID=5888 RepID=A0CZ66_PARTE|nr:uncharacterized protein GSPATT00039124001 [Paramecium tetraurelia]CAK76083.1 unnamed protein product [Paramecium tetraurelia]|eukprot:XP_001443480.1 hypothetical protein (macronuclear) [Paramecium tetraurelia strain d4-2]